MYDRQLKIYRGVYTPLTFTFKNEDQKAQNVVAKTYQFNIIDTESKKSVLTKTLKILDDGSTISTKGKTSVDITVGDIISLDAKFYNYSINEVLTDGSTLVTYADTSYVANGTLEILDGAYPEAVDSISVTSFTGTDGPLTKTSGSINAKPGINNNKALHTIAIYTQGFTGSLRVQGTMTSTPGINDWFDVTMDGAGSPTNTFTDSSTVTYYNFYGVYHSVRFSWGNDTDNTGIVDKILYRQ